jgi:hypothetical protein
MSAGKEAAYSSSTFEETRLRRFAARVADELEERGVPRRGPEPVREVEERVRTGFLGLRKETQRHKEGGGKPQFWLVAARRESGYLTVYDPGSVHSGPYVWVRGDALLLMTDGTLLYAEFWWEQARDSEGRYPVLKEIRVADEQALMMFDYADRGRWKRERPGQGSQYAEAFDRRYALTAHAKGVGASLALKRLLETGHQPYDVMVYCG